MNRTGEIERLKEAVEIGIKSIIQQSSLEHSRILDHLDRIKGLEPVDSCDVQKLSRILCGLSENLASISNVGTAVESEQCLLNSLHFEGLRHRQDNVASAHKSTLQWLLTDFPPKQYSGPPPELASWLRDGHGIYWVRGKPGSGKSTLMRFLCENEGTNSLLRDWSQSKKLVIAPYFFWSPGTKLQRSQKGLLQSLLYEVLQRCPELISKVYKDPERTHYRFPEEDWSFSELKTAFSQLKKQKDVSARFCFFIDGLDEYDGESQEGTYDDLIQTIEDFVKSPDIKVCLSSRPWNVFRDAFGCYPSLALENLNRDDIDSYVRSTLVEDQRFVRLCKENTFYQELVEEIVEKAQGVFLWVYLVVRSLRKGLVNSDTVEILRERVRSLPSDLKAFFCQILDSVDDVYKIQTARTFKVILACHRPFPLVGLACLDEDDCLGVNTKIVNEEPLKKRTVIAIHEEMRRRLDGQCRGLLEVTTACSKSNPFDTTRRLFFGERIEFLHRTVRDFLESKEMEHIFAPLKPCFDVQLMLCNIYLQLAKIAPRSSFRSDCCDALAQVMIYAREVERNTGVTPQNALEEVERLYLKANGDRLAPFLESLATHRLVYHVRHALDHRSSQIDSADSTRILRLLLFNPTDFIPSDCLLAVIEGLLSCGADSNSNDSESKKRSIWFSFALFFLHSFHLEHVISHDDLFEITKAFLTHGADSSALDPDVNREPSAMALVYSCRRFTITQNNELQQIIQRSRPIPAPSQELSQAGRSSSSHMARGQRRGFREALFGGMRNKFSRFGDA